MWDFFWIRKDRERWERAAQALDKREADIELRQRIPRWLIPQRGSWDAGPDLAQASWAWPEPKVRRKAVWVGGYDFKGGYIGPGPAYTPEQCRAMEAAVR